MDSLKGGKKDYDYSVGPANCRKYSFSWNNCWFNLSRAVGTWKIANHRREKDKGTNYNVPNR